MIVGLTLTVSGIGCERGEFGGVSGVPLSDASASEPYDEDLSILSTRDG